jgi:c-di-GMP-binding flagellar brake protein YcgR
MTVARPAPDKPDVYTYGVQFIDLDPVHYTLLQNMTYEALLADRLKIV